MTPSVYIIGGAGTGKSTFMNEILRLSGCQMGPLTDLYQKPNSRGTVITLRGHGLIGQPGEGLYLGAMRDEFPGTDGLDRVSYIPGEAWLGDPETVFPDFILGEGATLAVRRFLYPLGMVTDLLLVHLHAEDFVKDLRFMQRGSDQKESFVKTTATRSLNLWAEMKTAGVRTLDVDTADPQRWEYAIEETLSHMHA